jgi:hypothetical protein
MSGFEGLSVEAQAAALRAAADVTAREAAEREAEEAARETQWAAEREAERVAQAAAPVEVAEIMLDQSKDDIAWLKDRMESLSVSQTSLTALMMEQSQALALLTQKPAEPTAEPEPEPTAEPEATPAVASADPTNTSDEPAADQPAEPVHEPKRRHRPRL